MTDKPEQEYPNKYDSPLYTYYNTPRDSVRLASQEQPPDLKEATVKPSSVSVIWEDNQHPYGIIKGICGDENENNRVVSSYECPTASDVSNSSSNYNLSLSDKDV